MNGIHDSEFPGILHHPLFLAIKLYTNLWVRKPVHSDFQNSEWLMGDQNRYYMYHEIFVLKDLFPLFTDFDGSLSLISVL